MALTDEFTPQPAPSRGEARSGGPDGGGDNNDRVLPPAEGYLDYGATIPCAVYQDHLQKLGFTSLGSFAAGTAKPADPARDQQVVEILHHPDGFLLLAEYYDGALNKEQIHFQWKPHQIVEGQHFLQDHCRIGMVTAPDSSLSYYVHGPHSGRPWHEVARLMEAARTLGTVFPVWQKATKFNEKSEYQVFLNSLFYNGSDSYYAPDAGRLNEARKKAVTPGHPELLVMIGEQPPAPAIANPPSPA